MAGTTAKNSDHMSNPRLVLSLALVFVILLVGFIKSSQWLILPLGIVFSAAYIHGRWHTWERLFQQEKLRSDLYASLATTYVMETILVYFLYWSGRGVANILNYLELARKQLYLNTPEEEDSSSS